MAFRQESRRYLLDDESSTFEPGYSPQPSYPSAKVPPPQFPMPSPQPQQPSPYGGYPFPENAQDYPPAEPVTTKRSKWRYFVKGTEEMFKKRWPRYFFLVAVVQGAICIAFESYTFAKFSYGLNDWMAKNPPNEDVRAQLKTIPTFLSLFMFGFIYEVALAWDALLAKNTIQIIGVCIANLALLVYTAIQITDIGNSIEDLKNQNIFEDSGIWSGVHPLLVAIPCILAVGTLLLAFIAWKLYQEFAWDILKHIGADYRMKKRFLHYQVYIALLKFDFFFFIGFTVQFLVVVGARSPVEIGLTAAAIPVTMGILLLAAWFTRKEWKFGVCCIIILYLGGLAYFIFKLSRIYTPEFRQDYLPVAKSLTTFAVLTIILIVLTVTNALICMFNFGHGLKQHLLTPRHAEMDKDQASYSLNDVKQPQAPSRMTID